MAPRTVLHLIDTGGPGGAETVFLELVTGLDPAQWHPIAVVPTVDWLAKALRERGIEPTLIRSSGAFDVRYLTEVLRTIRRQRVDLIQTHLLGSAVYGRIAARITGIPIVSTFHGTVDVAERGIKRRLKNEILRMRGGRFVFVSAALRRELLQAINVDPRAAAVIHNGSDRGPPPSADRRRVRSEFGVGDDEVLVGAVGNIRPAKDYATLLRAAALITRRRTRIRFIVVGDTRSGLFAELCALRSALRLDSYVTFTGFRSDAASILTALDVFVLSSQTEGFSLATLEALAAGVPVVATRCGGPEEIVTDGMDGVLVEPGRPDLLAKAIERVAEDETLRHQLSERGRSTALRRFSMAAMLERYDALYSELLGIVRPGRGASLQWQES